jgi:hypothetical protein
MGSEIRKSRRTILEAAHFYSVQCAKITIEDGRCVNCDRLSVFEFA